MPAPIVANVVSVLFSLALKHMGAQDVSHAAHWVAPDIFRISHEQTEIMACRKSCRVRAFYLPGIGIFIDNDLEVETDEFARSVLLHELVHHVQALLGTYDHYPPCPAQQRSELEAYAVQNNYLLSVGSATHIVPIVTHALTCPPPSPNVIRTTSNQPGD